MDRHVHGPGFSETLHGRKHWVLSKDRPNFHPDQTSYNWMYYNYSHQVIESNVVDDENAENDVDKDRPIIMECTLLPGDLIYL